MSKKMSYLLVVILLLVTASLFATSMEVSGNISTNTTWTGVDTVKVLGNIYVDNGTLLAIGTAAEMITFTAANHSEGWNSIVFDNPSDANDTSEIVYCLLEYGKANSGDFQD